MAGDASFKVRGGAGIKTVYKITTTGQLSAGAMRKADHACSRREPFRWSAHAVECTTVRNSRYDSRPAVEDLNHDFQIDEVGLPHLIARGGLVLKFVGRLHHDEGWAADQTVEAIARASRATRQKVVKIERAVPSL